MATRALVALVAGLGGVIVLASSGASASAPPSPRPKPTRPPVVPPSPGPSSSTTKVLVSDAQKWLRALGAKLDADGLYGPKTAAAWASAAKARKLDPSFVRVDGKTARVAKATADRLAVLGLAASSGSSGPSGNVLLGPITRHITQPDGVKQTWTDSRGMTAAERSDWARETGDLSVYGTGPADLLSDDQAYALEAASVEQARATMDPSNAAQQEKAKKAAQLARDMLSRKGVPKAPARAPSNPTVSEPEQERGEDAPLAYVSPPTPINLELARREAPALAKHLKSKGRAGYSRQSLRAFQGHAGITVDGIYGPLSESALRYFGVPNPPAAYFKAAVGSVVTYSPT